MYSRLHTYCTRILEAGWLVAVAVIPLHFNPATSRIFEPNKIGLLRSIAVVMVVAWIVQVAEQWFSRSEKPVWSVPRALLQNGILVAAVLFLAVTALATVFSVLPHISLWGYFERLAGLYTTAAYLVFFLAIVAHLRTPAQLQRLITTIILASLPVALYGLIQQLGADPIAWAEAVDGRARSTLGYPAALAAMLALVVPLTLLRLIDAGRRRRYLVLAAYLMLLGLQIAVILFTRSRGPVLGLATGLFFGGLIWALLHHWRRTALALIGSSLTLVGCITLINLPNTPLGFVQDLPFLDRLTRIADPEGSAEGRVLIWEGTADLLAEKPQRLLLGYGPDTIRFVLYPHYTAELGLLHGWRAFVDRTHNETFDVLVTTGFLGLLCYLLLFTSIVYYGVRWLGLMAAPRQRILFLSCWSISGLLAVLVARWISHTWAFSGVALSFGLLAGLFCYLGVSLFVLSKRTEAPDAVPEYATLIVALLVGLLSHFVETNLGIAVSVTNLLFWIYTALLIGVGVVSLRHVPEVTQNKRIEKAPRSKKKKNRSAARNAPETDQAQTRSDVPALALLTGLMLMTLAYGFAGRLEMSGAMKSLLGGTWLLAGCVLFSERGTHFSQRLRDMGIYTALSLLPLLFFVWLSTAFFQRSPSQLLLFYGTLLGLMGFIAFVLYTPPPPVKQAATPWGITLMTILLLAAGWIIYQTNGRPLLASLYHQEAQIAFQKHQYDLAATSYWHALDINPTENLYKLEYGQLLAAKAQYRTPQPAERTQLFQEAERLLKEATADNPYEQYHPAALGEVYHLWAKSTPDGEQQKSRYALAVSAFDRALAINGENMLLWKQAVGLYEDMGDTDRARQAYEHILTWDSTSVGLQQRLAVLYQANKEIPKAIAAYEVALRHISQPSPSLYQTLATLYAQVDRLDEAVRASEQAVALAPRVLAYQTTLIDLYQQQGQCRKARTRAEAAIQQWPDEATLRTFYQNIVQQCGEATGNE